VPRRSEFSSFHNQNICANIKVLCFTAFAFQLEQRLPCLSVSSYPPHLPRSTPLPPASLSPFLGDSPSPGNIRFFFRSNNEQRPLWKSPARQLHNYQTKVPCTFGIRLPIPHSFCEKFKKSDFNSLYLLAPISREVHRTRGVSQTGILCTSIWGSRSIPSGYGFVLFVFSKTNIHFYPQMCCSFAGNIAETPDRGENHSFPFRFFLGNEYSPSRRFGST
jgi:hypothetical protein